jgi:hypothetical protein
MEALRLQIGSNLSAASGRIQMMDAKDKIERLIHKLLAIVDQAKEEHDLGEWVLMMAPTTYEFLRYKFISLLFEAFGYLHLAQIYVLDQSEKGSKTQIGYYSRARAIYDVFGRENESKHMTENIHRVRAETGGDKSLKFLKNIYHHVSKSEKRNAVETILSGFDYATSLIQNNHSIEAERLLTELVATSRQVYGEDHRCTRQTAPLLKKIKRRLVVLAGPDSIGTFQALRYENGGEICVVTDPIVDETSLIADENNEGQLFRVESAMVLPKPRCPVICHGLINASHLNGKLGEVRSMSMDSSSGGVRFGVHFEEKGLKPAAVKPENLRIVFELPSV